MKIFIRHGRWLHDSNEWASPNWFVVSFFDAVRAVSNVDEDKPSYEFRGKSRLLTIILAVVLLLLVISTLAYFDGVYNWIITAIVIIISVVMTTWPLLKSRRAGQGRPKQPKSTETKKVSLPADSDEQNAGRIAFLRKIITDWIRPWIRLPRDEKMALFLVLTLGIVVQLMDRFHLIPTNGWSGILFGVAIVLICLYFVKVSLTHIHDGTLYP